MTNDPSNRTSPLAIAVIGVGKIGSTFAYQLARAGHHVTAVARPGSKRLEQLRMESAVVTNKGDRAPVSVADALDEETPYDLIVVTTLAHQVDALLPALRRSKSKSVLFMFNVFDPERLAIAVGTERAAFGMPMVVASLEPHGRLRPMISTRRKTLLGDRRWADLFESSGIPSIHELHMPDWLRSHVPVCVCLEAVSIAGKRRGSGATWAEAVTVARGFKAMYVAIRALGHPVIPRAKAAASSSPAGVVASMLWVASRISFVRNAMANGLDECRSLVDDILVASAASPSAVPATVVASIKRMMPHPN